MAERKSLKETLNEQEKPLKETLSKEDAMAFVKGKMTDHESTVEKKRSSMKDINSELSSSDANSSRYKKRITTDLPPEVHQRLKLALAHMKTDSNKLVNALILNFLDENNY